MVGSFLLQLINFPLKLFYNSDLDLVFESLKHCHQVLMLILILPLNLHPLVNLMVDPNNHISGLLILINLLDQDRRQL